MPKPIIAYIESDLDYSGDNPWRDALSYVLREHHGCEIIHYNYESSFKEDLRRLKRLVADHMLVLVIVRQESYTNQHSPVKELVAAGCSHSIAKWDLAAELPKILGL